MEHKFTAIWVFMVVVMFLGGGLQLMRHGDAVESANAHCVTAEDHYENTNCTSALAEVAITEATFWHIVNFTMALCLIHAAKRVLFPALRSQFLSVLSKDPKAGGYVVVSYIAVFLGLVWLWVGTGLPL